MSDRGFDNDMMLAIVEELGLKGTLEELAVVCARMAEYAAEAENEVAQQAWATDEVTIQRIIPSILNEQPVMSTDFDADPDGPAAPG